MVHRLVEAFVPGRLAETVEGLLESSDALASWRLEVSNGHSVFKAVIRSEDAEGLLNALEDLLKGLDDAHVVVLPLEATFPRPPEPNAEADKADADTDDADGKTRGRRTPRSLFPRVSREELYQDVGAEVGVTRVFVAMALLSSIVAALGLYRDSVAVIIGAMVIAPLLGPNVALAFATTLADFDLARRALRVNVAGVLVALSAAVAIGFLFPVDPSVPQIASRTEVSLADIALGLAAGAAGVLAFTTGVPAALVGVMVAVALLPPMVAFGILVGGQMWPEAARAALLFAINVISVNLAAVVMFLLSGVRPRRWGQLQRARLATMYAILVWVALLAVLALLVHLAR